MAKCSHYLLALSMMFGFVLSQQLAAQSVDDIQEYCQSMTGEGLSLEDNQSFISDCIAEQRSYLEQDVEPEQYDDISDQTSESNAEQEADEEQYDEKEYEQEDYGQDQKCYAKVDEDIQKLLDIDPNTDFDYDQLLDQCFNGKL